jgi:cysteinyl-tRNA synthetase
MDDDFNTPQALVILEQLKSYAFSLTVNDGIRENLTKFKYVLATISDLMKIFALSPEKVDLQDRKLASKSSLKEVIKEAWVATQSIQKLIDERDKLKKDKRYKEADKIREELEKSGVILEDLKDGKTKWRWK